MENRRESVYLKKVIWLYFILLIFEGALRKWVLPGLSGPLLIIRDPLAIYIILKVWHCKIWKPNNYVLLIWAITILSLSLTLILGHGNLTVAVYGFRITGLHFPLIFIIGTLFNQKDVIQMGKIILWLTIAMTILVAIQFFSPQFAWVNRGVGGDMEGSGFSGAAGYFRVPGTFSFTNGLASFFGLAATFIFYFWTDRSHKINHILLLLSTFALVVAIPLSMSRTVLFQTLLTFIFLIIVSARDKRIFAKMVVITLAIGFLIFSFKGVSFIQTANNVFSERMITANKVEGGIEKALGDRILGGMVGALSNNNFSFWGKGLGIGTNAGAAIFTGKIGGDGVFLISEDEWGRIIGEMGIILGIIFVLIRMVLVCDLAKNSWREVCSGNVLPWMLLSFGLLIILQGQWAQPTTLGFSVLIGGLIIASYEKNDAS